jgi:hypothetical protein
VLIAGDTAFGVLQPLQTSVLPAKGSERLMLQARALLTC